MNNVILMGRLVRDPEIRYGQNNGKAVCRYTLAVDRYGSSQDGQNTDFIDIVAFDKNGEFAEKYFRKGMRILIQGRIQTGSYVNREGQKVKTTEVVIERQEFADGKESGYTAKKATQPIGDPAFDIPDDPAMPWNQ